MSNKLRKGQDGFFDDEEVRNKASDKPRTKGERDKLLDLYFSGAAPGRLGRLEGRGTKAGEMFIDKYTSNYEDKVRKYEPVERASRIGKRFTPNEFVMIKSLREEKPEQGKPVEWKYIARLLQRKKDEVSGQDMMDKSKVGNMKTLATSLDLVLAYRYLYYTKGVSMVTDKVYDELEAEEREFGAGAKWLDKVGSDNPEDYPPHIRALGMYLAFKYAEREKHED